MGWPKQILFQLTAATLIAAVLPVSQAGVEASPAIHSGRVYHSRHFSPVTDAEKSLAESINSLRAQQGIQAADMDWDLFRLARLQAAALADGRLHAVDNRKIESLLRQLGRAHLRIRSIVLPADQSSTIRHNELKRAADRRIRIVGTGQASGSSGRFQVILCGYTVRGNR
ncbi:MAG: hypothetical protein LKI80_05505 [Sporolactobacillus sp.]|jgi:hypothetical protein|nr:hypothetical protein [Sporolactobacillus sp.]